MVARDTPLRVFSPEAAFRRRAAAPAVQTPGEVPLGAVGCGAILADATARALGVDVGRCDGDFAAAEVNPDRAGFLFQSV